jgi:hypothetical protein
MSKNKNPLKDLDLFLKQQAASFVNPTRLSEKIPVDAPAGIKTSDSSEETILQSIERLIEQNPAALYDMLIQAAEKKTSPERTVLINTALYLKNTNNWKETVREYWRTK